MADFRARGGLRFFGGAAIAFLQILILLTGNYTFFNWLTLALCLLLLDDFVLAKFVPIQAMSSSGSRLSSLDSRPAESAGLASSPFRLLRSWWQSFTCFKCRLLFGARPAWFYPVAIADAWLEPFRTFNSYGLFAVMTTERREIIVEGSDDGVNWLPYEFKYKPGDVNRRPGFVAPYPAAAGLADVVCRAGRLPAEPVVREFLPAPVARFAAGSGVAGEKSVSRSSAALPPRRALRLSIYQFRRAARDRRVVETGTGWANICRRFHFLILKKTRTCARQRAAHC